MRWFAAEKVAKFKLYTRQSDELDIMYLLAYILHSPEVDPFAKKLNAVQFAFFSEIDELVLVHVP